MNCATILPVELVQLLVDYSVMAELWALALVNKHYNHCLTPFLYENIAIHTLRRIRSLRNTLMTGRPHLRDYPKALTLTTLRDSEPNEALLSSSLRSLLLLTPNILRLSLVLPGSVTRHLIEEPRYPFALRRLSMSTVSGEQFLKFLESQEQIEEICFCREKATRTSCRDRRGRLVTPRQPRLGILPNLKSIEASPFWVHTLVPFRPVTRVAFEGPGCSVTLAELRSNNHAIAQSSAPLTHLVIGLRIASNTWYTELLEAISSINYGWNTLRELTIRIFPEFGAGTKRSVLWLLEVGLRPNLSACAMLNIKSQFSSRIMRL
ncbi:hypothetical protein FRC08_009849 [Ceratobasidium sp. 394]|nr:hypothetical protein FRC08_009849 [Ceratobasidium sp. 394]